MAKGSISLVGNLLKCKAEGCNEYAVSLSDFCWDHTRNRAAYRSEIEERVRKGQSLRNSISRKRS